MKTDVSFPLVLVAAAIMSVVLLSDGRLDAIAFVLPVVQEVPTVNLPKELRQENWQGGADSSGSCCHASLVSLLRWQGKLRIAKSWRKSHGGGEFSFTMRRQLDTAGVRYAWTVSGDERFLEWALATRRGACIKYMSDPDENMQLTPGRSYHMVNVVHLTDKMVGILDNNDISKLKWMKRDEFMENWKASQGWAFTPVYSPAAPLPPRSRRERS